MTLSELVVRVSRGWRILVVGGLAALTLAVAVHLLLPTRFTAETIVHVPGTDPSLVDMTAEASLARSQRVAAEARAAIGRDAPPVSQVQSATAAEALRESSVLRISFHAGDARDAARGADAVAHAYLATRAVDAAARTDRVDARIAREMRRVDAETRAALATERARLAIADDLGSGQVVDTARVPTSPSGPGLLATGLGGLVLGLLVSAPVAVSRGRGGRAS